MLCVFGIDHGIVRDVVANHGTSAGSDTAADFDRSHEQVAGTDVHVRSDGGVVLVHAIIVGGDSTAADVGIALPKSASPT